MSNVVNQGLLSGLLGGRQPQTTVGAPMAPGAPAAPSGFLQSDEFGNMLQAAGMSLLSSPRSAPLSNLGQYLPAIQEQSMKRRAVAEAKDKENKTLAFLDEKFPDIAAQVRGGLPVDEAFNMAIKTQAMAREDAQFAKTYGLQREKFDYERSQAEGARNKTVEWAARTGDPDIIGLVGAGQFDAALKVWQTKRTGADRDIETFYDDQGRETRGYYDPTTQQMVQIGGAKAANKPGALDLTMPDGTRVQMGGTEGQRRGQQLYSVAQPELETVNRTFDALSGAANQAAGAMGRPGNFLTSSDYQEGTDAVTSIVKSYLYSVSGATATDDEVRTQTQLLMPAPGDSPARIAQKKARIQTMTNAIGMQAGIDANAPSKGGATNIYRDRYGLEE